MTSEFAKHLLIDGANILHAWPELRRHLPGDRETARSQLAKAVAILHDAEKLRISLVFDGRGPELAVEHPSGHPTFALIYTPSGTTADDVIEQLVANSRAPAACLVATDDRAERQMIESLGAAGLSSADLAAWVAQASQRMGARLDQRKRLNDQDWKGGAR